MATVADTLYTIRADVPAGSVNMVFSLVDGPLATASGITSRERYTITTDETAGTFSIDLREGVFLVQWRLGLEWSQIFIGVPDDAGTYTFADIATEAESTISSGTVRYFSTVASFESQGSGVPLVFIAEDSDSNPAWFEKSTDSTNGLTSGIDFITDSQGNNYMRRRTT